MSGAVFVITCDLPEWPLSASDLTVVAVFRSGAKVAIGGSGAAVMAAPDIPAEAWRKKFRTALYPFPADSVFAGIYSLEPNYDLAQLKGVTSQFLDEASVYHSKYNNHPLWTTLLENAFRAIPEFQAPREVLDIGSGSGNTVIPLLRLFPGVRVVAVDISPQLLAILRDQMTPEQRDRCLLIAADASDQIFANDTFDLVIGAAILHHIMDPLLTISSCLEALCRQCVAIFFEPFEAGASILRLLYGKLIEKWEELNLSPAVVDALQRLSHDFTVRAGTDKSAPIYRELDDKWLFTRTYFEEVKAKLPVADITIRPLYFSDNPFAAQVKTHLRLCLGEGPDVLPQAAWKVINEFEETFSPSLGANCLSKAQSC